MPFGQRIEVVKWEQEQRRSDAHVPNQAMDGYLALAIQNQWACIRSRISFVIGKPEADPITESTGQ